MENINKLMKSNNYDNIISLFIINDSRTKSLIIDYLKNISLHYYLNNAKAVNFNIGLVINLRFITFCSRNLSGYHQPEAEITELGQQQADFTATLLL